MDRNSLLQSTFEIVTWPEIQNYMTIDNFKENAILINIAYNNGYSDAEYKI